MAYLHYPHHHYSHQQLHDVSNCLCQPFGWGDSVRRGFVQWVDWLLRLDPHHHSTDNHDDPTVRPQRRDRQQAYHFAAPPRPFRVYNYAQDAAGDDHGHDAQLITTTSAPSRARALIPRLAASTTTTASHPSESLHLMFPLDPRQADRWIQDFPPTRLSYCSHLWSEPTTTTATATSGSRICSVTIYGSFVAHLSQQQRRCLWRAIGSKLPHLVKLQWSHFDHTSNTTGAFGDTNHDDHDHSSVLTVSELAEVLTQSRIQNQLEELAFSGGVKIVMDETNNTGIPSLEQQLAQLKALKKMKLAHVTLFSPDNTNAVSSRSDEDNENEHLHAVVQQLPVLVPTLEQLEIRGRQSKSCSSSLRSILSARHNTTSCLTVLKLFLANLTNQRIASLTQALQHNTSLREVWIRAYPAIGTTPTAILTDNRNGQDQRLDDTTVSALQEMFRGNQTLQRFQLRGRDVDQAQALALARALEFNKSLTFVRFDVVVVMVSAAQSQSSSAVTGSPLLNQRLSSLSNNNDNYVYETPPSTRPLLANHLHHHPYYPRPHDPRGRSHHHHPSYPQPSEMTTTTTTTAITNESVPPLWLIQLREYRRVLNYYLTLNRSGVRTLLCSLYEHVGTTNNHTLLQWIQAMQGKESDCLYYMVSNYPAVVT